MRRWLIRCYPAQWRDRYGDEFGAVLDDMAIGPFDVADILLGALDARLRRRGRALGTAQGRAPLMALRIGGIAALVATVSWVILGFNLKPGAAFEGTVAAIAFVSLLALLIAVTGLSAFQARRHPRLIWSAFVVLAAGTVAMAVGAAAELLRLGAGPWNEAMVAVGGLSTLAGSALFGIATYRNSVLSRDAAALLVAGPAFAVLCAGLAPVNLDLAYLLVLPTMFCLLGGWFAMGISAIRLDRRSSAPQPA